MSSFLQLLAQDLIDKRGDRFDNLTIIFPNKRAGLFLTKELTVLLKRPVWIPKISTLGEFIEQHTGLRQIDELPLIIKLYKSYQICSGSTEKFEDFYFWGHMLLGDFDDIDKYRGSAKDIFSNVAALKKIEIDFPYLTQEQIQLIQEFWRNFNIGKYSEEQQKFIQVWEKLYPTYQHFRDKLFKEGICYEGMGQRFFCEHLDQLQTTDDFVFAGFNALNPCEKKIFSHFRDSHQARFYWDYDLYYSTNENHEAGLYIRENIKTFPNELDIEHFNNFRHSKKQIEYIATPSVIGQAKLLPTLLHELHEKKTNYTDTAIILCDEQLLSPVLHAIPDEIDKINITMGYPARNSSVFALINMLGDLKKHIKQNDGITYYYYKTVIALLNHPFIKTSCPEKILKITNDIHAHNIVYVAETELQLNSITQAIFSSQEENLPTYLSRILKQLVTLTSTYNNSIEKEFLFNIFTKIQQIQNTFEEEKIATNDKFYLRMIDKILREISIPFSGEPLEGMQIMGLMETRMLDFKNLILLSTNEGIIPQSSHSSSFIPYHLRKGFALPTPEHQEALFAYYFYRLLQRSEQIKLLYNDTTKGTNTGEMSRFLYQLKYESGLSIKESFFQNKIAATNAIPIIIHKNQAIIEQLTKYTRHDSHGISPSALNIYLECQLRFYFKYLANIQEKEEITEELDQRLLGTIFHKCTQSLFQTLNNQTITSTLLEELEKNDTLIEEHILQAYSEIYDTTTSQIMKSGANQLVLSVVKKYVKKVFEYDKSFTPFKIISMETTYRMPIILYNTNNSSPVYITGNIDRVDQTQQGIRIIDYKTGADKTDFKNLTSLFDPNNTQRNKAAFQTLLYCMMYDYEKQSYTPLIPGIYSTKLLFSPNYNYQFICEKKNIDQFQDYKEEFKQHLTLLLSEIFSPSIPFQQTELIERCSRCPYKQICRRQL